MVSGSREYKLFDSGLHGSTRSVVHLDSHLSILLCRAIFTLVCAAATTLLLSCQNPFSPASIEPSGAKPIVRQSDPDSVLRNFKYSYEHNDIDVYEKCLDPNFVFRYTDQDRFGEIEWVNVPRDGPSGDLERTRKLFMYFDEIRLDSWQPIPSGVELVNDDTLEVYRVYFQLSVRDLDGDFAGDPHQEALGIAVFKFRKSKVDGLWRIVFWEDRSI